MKQKIVAFGEILLRLSPVQNGLISNAAAFEAVYGGTESNVLVTLSGLGHDTEYLSVVPDNAFGTAVERHLRRYGVGITHLCRRGEVLGSYYLEQGFGNRPSSVIYNRRSSEIARADETLFSPAQYDAIFADCRLFHISGISFGLSEGCRALSYHMMEEAHRRGISVSFDCNYRAKVWGAYPAAEFESIMKQAEILFCSQRDLDAISCDAETLFTAGRAQTLVLREKEALGDDAYRASCSMIYREKGTLRHICATPITYRAFEKIGAGDAFDAGMLHFLSRESYDSTEAMRFALGCYEMKQTIPGDIMCVSEEEILRFLAGREEGKGLNR